MKKPYLIAEILLERGLPVSVVKEITDLADQELQTLKRKWNVPRL
ncbi:hypothetical protein [Bacillus sp. CECT 9360]|nr:hypothetical protein [Bacillus sp. CECT 9360]